MAPAATLDGLKMTRLRMPETSVLRPRGVGKTPGSGFGAFGPGTSRESLSEEGQVVEEDGRDDSTLSPTVGRVVLVHMPVHCTVQCICQLAG